ncbi:GNAT family N-acetyltransferase [Urbifossiella limnaea]|uniref:Putative acetyltransferase n=1 Tax=Urbifossiella limnaea TaxID=2528023 RepID=A0A517XTR4_9BACT|nr:GNAT family N-acetyltransferase [Urbifossiella limnaea]QDU20901.1 putative acetyltransferase [Urbifossiella limnaea]
MRRIEYYKRYRMELDLRRPPTGAADESGHILRATLPAGCHWLPWHDSLLGTHAEVKALSFLDELDTAVFPCLGSLAGCHDLMTAIRTRPGFCPQATWLVGTTPDHAALARGCVGTIQGLIDDAGHGGVQNIGVLPELRGRGIGRALLLKALAGFAAVGVKRVFLEVTALNEPAVRMYRSIGFRCTRTTYRGVPAAEVRAGI